MICICRIIIWSLLFLLLVSCKTVPLPTEAPPPAVKQKMYIGIPSSQLKKSAEELLRLSDEDDVIIRPETDGLVAERKWFRLGLHGDSWGTDKWVIKISENSNGALVSVEAFSRSCDLITCFMPEWDKFNPIENAELYDLFWKRLDYLAGKQSRWTTCEDAYRSFKTVFQKWAVDLLCHPTTITEGFPQNLSEAEVDRIFEKKYYRKWAYLKKLNPARWEKQAEIDQSIRYREK